VVQLLKRPNAPIKNVKPKRAMTPIKSDNSETEEGIRKIKISKLKSELILNIPKNDELN